MVFILLRLRYIYIHVHLFVKSAREVLGCLLSGNGHIKGSKHYLVITPT